MHLNLHRIPPRACSTGASESSHCANSTHPEHDTPLLKRRLVASQATELSPKRVSRAFSRLRRHQSPQTKLLCGGVPTATLDPEFPVSPHMQVAESYTQAWGVPTLPSRKQRPPAAPGPRPEHFSQFLTPACSRYRPPRLSPPPQPKWSSAVGVDMLSISKRPFAFCCTQTTRSNLLILHAG